MPRPRTISWDKRVSIFLDYRRRGKVFPTAKLHGVARSTVAAIIKEFKAADFSDGPRLNLSRSLLVQAQDHHLREIMVELGVTSSVDVIEPSRNFRGGLDPEAATSTDLSLELPMRNSLSIADSLLWHIKETRAEETIRGANQAITDYNQRCLELWRDISSALAEECRLPVQPMFPNRITPGPYVAHELVDFIYLESFGPSGLASLAPEDWTPSPDDPSILNSGPFAVAVGEPAHHDAVRRGAVLYLSQALEQCQQRAQELRLLHHDLKYLASIVEETLAQLTQDQIRNGICPGCPYPEALIQLHQRGDDGE